MKIPSLSAHHYADGRVGEDDHLTHKHCGGDLQCKAVTQ